VQQEGVLCFVPSHDTNQQGEEESHDLIDGHHFRVIHAEAAAVWLNNACSAHTTLPAESVSDEANALLVSREFWI
jgi:hypothetical protein